jgi:predicted alpha/beta-hydrolase family hydrolase
MALHGGKDTSSPSRCSPEKLSPVVVLAHGAGAPSSSDWMIRSIFNLQFSNCYFNSPI